jgi:DNA-binding LacI/PurR family transcriptional regulator
MADAGFAVPGHYVKSGLHERAVTLQHIDELLDLDQPPTAVVASADSHAMIAAEGARAHGFSVPDDLSVVGFDDLDIAQHLDLSTIRQPLYESGAQGTRMLLDIMEGVPSAPQQVEMPLELVARGSTAAPRYS